MSRLDDLNHEQLEGVHELVQAWDAAKRRYFEEHLPACKCVSCRAEPDPFVSWINSDTDQTFGEWMHDPHPPASQDFGVCLDHRSLLACPTFARWWMFLGDVAHLGYRAACAIIWGIGWMIRGPLISIVSAGRTIVRACVPRFLWPRVMPSKRLRRCAYCGHNGGAAVTGCPDHGGINPRPGGVKPPPPPAPPARSSVFDMYHMNAASVEALATVLRETTVTVDEAKRAMMALAQGGPPDSGEELKH